MPSPGVVVAAGGLALAAAGWAAAQRADRQAISSDPRGAALFAELGGERSTVVARDGTRLAVRSFGPEDAPTIVFAHGWTCSSEFWKLQIGSLSAERRVIAYDQRGHGESDPALSADYSIEALGLDLGRILEASVPEGERALLVGHSLGALTIIAWAGSHPDPSLVDRRASAAVLVNTGVSDLLERSLVTTALGGRRTHLQRSAGERLLRARAPIPAHVGPISHRLVRRAVVGPDASPAEVAFCEGMIADCPPLVRSAVGRTLPELDLKTALARLRVPALVISGQNDLLTPPSHARVMADALPDLLDVVEIPRSGHMSPVEAPAEVSGLIGRLAGLGQVRIAC